MILKEKSVQMDEIRIGNFLGDNSTTDLTAPLEVTWILEVIARQIYNTSIFSGISFGVGIIGVIGNILVMIVYSKLGFVESIHISYVALAAVDLRSVVSIIGPALLRRVLLPFLNIHLQDPSLFTNVITGWPNMAFTRTSALITAWMRCLCVTFPMTFKIAVTRAVTKVVVMAIFVVGCVPVIFGYSGYSFQWDSDPERNQTVLLVFNNQSNKLNLLNRIALILYGAIYPMLAWVTLSICTMVLVIKLKQSNQWRQRNARARITGQVRRRDEARMSIQKLRVTKTVVIVASLFIALSFPASVHLLLTLVMREKFANDGLYPYLFMAMSCITLVSNEINSCVNIFVFTAMGSKFRKALWQVLHITCSGN